jgi:hypothetical protein
MTLKEYDRPATSTGFGLQILEASVIEVQDLLWKQLESPIPRDFKHCIIANGILNERGVLYSHEDLKLLSSAKLLQIVRTHLCSPTQQLAATVEECRQIEERMLLDMCPEFPGGRLDYDLHQQTAAASYDARSQFATASGGGTVVQTLTMPFLQNCLAERTPQWSSEIPTEVNCFPGQKCLVALVAHTSTPASGVEFMSAPGSDTMSPGGQACTPGFDPMTCPVVYDEAPCGCCGSRSLCNEDGSCGAEILSEHRCRFHAPTPSIEDVGRMHVMCLVAKASFCRAPGQESEPRDNCVSETDACYSTPLCVRFNFVGHPPAFVSPTPLAENAKNVNGEVMKGYTDIGACVGYNTPFELAAHDVDAGDQVRIVVDDQVRQTSFFFSDIDFSSPSCGAFQAYGAGRTGNNARQNSFLHLLNAEFDSTIIAPLNEDVSWASGTANQSITYTLSEDKNNGIFIRSDCATTQMCRQRLLNADRTICGYALDNSRGRYKRWSGGRTASHNFGSYSSPRHCWRIRLQAPPSFVTNSSGCVAYHGDSVTSSCTPFAPEAHTIRDPTDNHTAYAKIRMGYTSRLDVSFVAYDPNPDDGVTIYVLDDLGIPTSMTVSRVQCLERPAQTEDRPERVQGLLSKGECLEGCAAGSDEKDTLGVSRCECKNSVASKTFCPVDLKCNRAKMRLQWQPQVQDAGKVHKVHIRKSSFYSGLI